MGGDGSDLEALLLADFRAKNMRHSMARDEGHGKLAVMDELKGDMPKEVAIGERQNIMKHHSKEFAALGDGGAPRDAPARLIIVPFG